jgi:hypothetical protein
MSANNENKKEDWMNSKWRPMMGWSYMATCIADFIVFPVLWSLLQAVLKQPLTPWNPLTLQGAGLYHVAMGAVLGIAAFGRTQEKMIGANNGGVATPPTAPMPAPVINSFKEAPVSSPAPDVPAAPANTFTASGKKIVPQSPDPEI